MPPAQKRQRPKSPTKRGEPAAAAFTYTNKKGDAYTLHTKTGKAQTPLYFFSRKKKQPTAPVPLPQGMTAFETGTGLPMVKKTR